MSNTNSKGKWYESEIGKQITSKKYFHQGEKSFEQVASRVANLMPTDEAKANLKEAMLNGDLIPAGRTLYAAGSVGKFKASCSNCYILPQAEDNIESIFNVAREMARIYSYGGGCGLSLSKLRPDGAKVTNAARTSTGSVSFADIYDSIGCVIGANNRRSALMLALDSWHPDIENFLDAKKNNDKLQSANLSILFHDDFLEAVENNQEYELKFDVEATGEKIRKTINARDFFMRFCQNNFDFAEPGSIFIDRVRSYNLLSGYPSDIYNITVSNPCSEFFGNSYNSCNLTSLNLYNMVDNPFTDKASINYEKLEKTVALGIETLDEILTYGRPLQPLEENKKCIDDWRSIGLGVFGVGDMLVALKIKYGSDESIEIIENVMNHMFTKAVETSANLAKTKGKFGKYEWKYIKESPMIKMLEGTPVYALVKKYGLRNGSLLSIAPTGSISSMCGVSGGTEPLYAISYERTTHALEKTGQTFRVFAKSVEDLLRYHGLPTDLSDTEIMSRFPFVTVSHEINPLDRIRVQSAMQQFVDNAISSTINLKESATVEDIYNIYMSAWKSGCKGITVFRDNCARTSILGKEHDRKPVAPLDNTITFDKIHPAKRSDIKKLTGTTVVKSTACVPKMYITLNNKDGELFEVFTAASTGCKSNIGNITRLASLALRSGVAVDEVVSELRENICPACTTLKQQGKNVCLSCGNAIAEAIEEAYKDIKGTQKSKDEHLAICPECGEHGLIPEGKCVTCLKCGWSKCS